MKSWRFALSYLFGWLFFIFGSLLFLTCRLKVFGKEIEDLYFKENYGKSLLYATWHRGLVFIVNFYRKSKFVVMASNSEDGEMAAQSAKRFGWKIVRGSSTRRGGQALREMLKFVKDGYYGGLVVDAPKGPAHRSKLGIIFLAQISGIPLLPVMWSANRYWRLGSWDRTIIPKPFSRIVLLYPESLIQVPSSASREDCEHYRRKLDDVLNKMMFQTDNFFTTPGISDPRQIKVPDLVSVAL